MTLVCSSFKVLLPGLDDLQPATISIDLVTGKITGVQLGRQPRESYPEGVHWLDVGEKIILPGLVECV